jgi:hypothetical protein
MKLNLKINSMLLCLALFAACSSDDDGQVAQDSSQEQKQPQKTYPLSIEVAENPMVQEGEGGSSRRAAQTNTSSLSKFYLDYAYNSTGSDGTSPITATKDAYTKKWSCGESSWPGIAYENGYEVTWYAYSNSTFHPNSSNPYLSFTVEELASNHHDLLVATTKGTYTSSIGDGKLSFTFDHACSALRFLVKKAKNLDDYTLNITPSSSISIKLFNVVNQGRYYYNNVAPTPKWELADSWASYTLSSGTFENLRSDAYTELAQGDGPYLFMIPQTLTAWNHTGTPANTYIELNCSITKSGDPGFSYSGKAYIPFSATFAPGYQYDVKINIGKGSLYKVVGEAASLIIP